MRREGCKVQTKGARVSHMSIHPPFDNGNLSYWESEKQEDNGEEKRIQIRHEGRKRSKKKEMGPFPDGAPRYCSSTSGMQVRKPRRGRNPPNVHCPAAQKK